MPPEVSVRQRPLLSLILAGSLAGTFVGCSDQAAQQQRADLEQFKQVLAKYEEAQRGFVYGADSASAKSYRAFRQQKMAEASKLLETFASKGTPAQQVASRRLLADIQASAGSYIAEDAAVLGSAIGSQGAEVLSYVVTIDLSQIQAKSVPADESELITKLSSDRLSAQRDAADIRQEAQTLRSQIKKLEQTIGINLINKNNAAAKALSLREKAFVTKGDEQLKLYAEADEAQRVSDSASADAERVSVRKAAVESELRILDQRAESYDALLKTIDTLETEAKARQAAAVTVIEAATKAGQDASKELLEKFAALAKNYSDGVDEPLRKAEAKLAESVKTLEGALTIAPGPNAEAVKIDLLLRYVQSAHVYGVHIHAAESYTRSLRAVATAGARLVPASAGYFTENADNASRQLDQLANVARQIISEGTKLASDMSVGKPDTDATATLAIEQNKRLEGYAKRISASAPNSGSPAATTSGSQTQTKSPKPSGV
jgi:hypothetical protein